MARILRTRWDGSAEAMACNEAREYSAVVEPRPGTDSFCGLLGFASMHGLGIGKIPGCHLKWEFCGELSSDNIEILGLRMNFGLHMLT